MNIEDIDISDTGYYNHGNIGRIIIDLNYSQANYRDVDFDAVLVGVDFFVKFYERLPKSDYWNNVFAGCWSENPLPKLEYV